MNEYIFITKKRMTDEIRKKLWDICLVVDDIKEFPQTYGTILKTLYNNGTCQIILRRKLSSLCKEGTLFKTTIPGTRFGKVIFYTMPKKYHLLVEGDRIGSHVYCFFKFKKVSKYYINIAEYWILKNDCWIKKKDRTIFEGNVLKWI